MSLKMAPRVKAAHTTGEFLIDHRVNDCGVYIIKVWQGSEILFKRTFAQSSDANRYFKRLVLYYDRLVSGGAELQC